MEQIVASLCYVGMWVGEAPIRLFISRFGRWLLLSEQDLDRSLNFFNRHGGLIILFGRLIPGVRSPISLPAGMQRMPLLSFLAYTTLGSAVWVGALGCAGLILGAHRETILLVIDQFVLLSLIAASVVLFVIWRLSRLVLVSARANDLD
jgi:membrane protein DedA with SNARE-associated domain